MRASQSRVALRGFVKQFWWVGTVRSILDNLRITLAKGTVHSRGNGSHLF